MFYIALYMLNYIFYERFFFYLLFDVTYISAIM